MEFALLVPLLLLSLLLIVEVSLVARAQFEVVAAAREGARRAAIDPDPAQAAGVVREALGAGHEDVAVTVRRPHVVGQLAEVIVVVPHRVGLPLLGGFTVRLRGRAVMRVEL